MKYDWHLDYTIDVTAETLEDALRQAMDMVRNPTAVATWDYSYERENGDLAGGRVDCLGSGDQMTVEVTDTWAGE